MLMKFCGVTMHQKSSGNTMRFIVECIVVYMKPWSIQSKLLRLPWLPQEALEQLALAKNPKFRISLSGLIGSNVVELGSQI
jgi:hypothetical protein